MTTSRCHEFLEELGRSWTGQGAAVELGCWMGASAVSLLRGLTEAGYDKVFWGFERFRVNKEQVQKAKQQNWGDIWEGDDLRPVFLHHCRQVYRNTVAVKGNLPAVLNKYEGGKIEMCVFDAPKQEPVFTGCVKRLIKHWIPGVTVLGLLDYHFYLKHEGKKRKQFRAPVDFMEKYGDYFTRVKDWGQEESAVFFKYEKELRL